MTSPLPHVFSTSRASTNSTPPSTHRNGLKQHPRRLEPAAPLVHLALAPLPVAQDVLYRCLPPPPPPPPRARAPPLTVPQAWTSRATRSGSTATASTRRARAAPSSSRTRTWTGLTTRAPCRRHGISGYAPRACPRPQLTSSSQRRSVRRTCAAAPRSQTPAGPPSRACSTPARTRRRPARPGRCRHRWCRTSSNRG